MQANEIRKQFLAYFEKHQHALVPSASLIPMNDPSLLFVNAGMVQFKDYFLGAPAPYPCAVTAQPCLRVGGKHNDLKNVGYTTRHHTLFEMLGNFSFGDYFKEKAIVYAWEFITNVLGISTDKLWVTVHYEDQESYDLWQHKMGVAVDRIIKCGDADNFWSMGDTGPCGPCTEIFYDHGPDVAGGPPGSPDADGDRYVEIWNLVFMQYDRQADGTTKPLPLPCVDTGMGLERIAAVMQGVASNYDADCFQTLIKRIETQMKPLTLSKIALQVIADHLRSSVFIMANGVYPGNEGRAYVLRRIIRRALRYAYQSGQTVPVMHKLVPYLIDELGDAYPILRAEQVRIESAMEKEEQKFFQTLEQGMTLLESALAKHSEISGELAFKLYDTYGFPIDIAEDVAKEKGINIDVEGFWAHMETQRQRSRSAAKFDSQQSLPLEGLQNTPFIGDFDLKTTSTIVALITDGKRVDQFKGEGFVVLNETPFYPEGGGQVGDTGLISGDQLEVEIMDTQKQGDVIIHQAKVVKGELALNDQVTASVDAKRFAIKRHHSATHLLHAALRNVLGDHVEQKGSLVDEGRLRFDFAYGQPMTIEQQDEVEALVNKQIYAALPVQADLMTMDSAIEQGAIALFGDKYQKEVRVLSMGSFSKELCGGTHVHNTQEIGAFKLVSESGVASGVRRIEAVAGEKALTWYQSQWQLLKEASACLKVAPVDVVKRIEQVQIEHKKLKQQLSKQQSIQTSTLESKNCGGYKVFMSHQPEWTAETLMMMVDQYKQQEMAILFLLGGEDDKPHPYVIAINKKALSDSMNAKMLLQQLQQSLDIKGGGRDDLVRGVCKSSLETIENTMQVIEDWVS